MSKILGAAIAPVRTFAVDVKEGSGVKRVVEASCKPA